MEADMALTSTKKKETKEAVAKEAPKPSATAQIAALDKLAKTGGYNSQWVDAWVAYKEAAGL